MLWIDADTVSPQRCNYEENFSYGCYMAAAGGCPTPTRAVSCIRSNCEAHVLTQCSAKIFSNRRPAPDAILVN